MEESLGCIFDADTLKHYLELGTVYTRTSSMGQHYTVVCDLGEMDLDIDKANVRFADALKNPNLVDDQKENDFLVVVPLDEIRNAISKTGNNDVLITTVLDGKET